MTMKERRFIVLVGCAVPACPLAKLERALARP